MWYRYYVSAAGSQPDTIAVTAFLAAGLTISLRTPTGYDKETQPCLLQHHREPSTTAKDELEIVNPEFNYIVVY